MKDDIHSCNGGSRSKMKHPLPSRGTDTQVVIEDLGYRDHRSFQLILSSFGDGIGTGRCRDELKLR